MNADLACCIKNITKLYKITNKTNKIHLAFVALFSNGFLTILKFKSFALFCCILKKKLIVLLQIIVIAWFHCVQYRWQCSWIIFFGRCWWAGKQPLATWCSWRRCWWRRAALKHRFVALVVRWLWRIWCFRFWTTPWACCCSGRWQDVRIWITLRLR